MVYELIFHTHVEAEIRDAHEWYESKQEGLGERFLNDLTTCYNKLQTHPEFFGKALRKYRRLVMNHFPYIIAFEILHDKVFVYAVFHTSRNPKEINKRQIK